MLSVVVVYHDGNMQLLWFDLVFLVNMCHHILTPRAALFIAVHFMSGEALSHEMQCHRILTDF